ncbi:hypothetical protein R50073_13830 [Maricurvus nonylphenolicus]|uniref:hypothetical protein n=1 Tax=Maricurvus nonylphenolicus TaxID=1008307 RepID=UPI0036F3A58D
MQHRQHDKYATLNPISRYLLLPIFFLVIAGCAQQPAILFPSSLPSTSAQDTYSPTEAVTQCYAFYDDIAKHTQQVNYPAVFRVQGYPFLRSNRFLASFAEELAGQQQARWQSWLVQLNQQAINALLLEWQQLPLALQQQLADSHQPISRRKLQQELQGCGVLLVRALLQQSELSTELLELAQVPDHYSTLKRTLGLYPLVKPFFNAGVEREISHLQEQRRRFADAPLSASVYDGRSIATADKPQPLVVDQLGIPLLSAEQAQSWLAQWRPVWLVQESGDYDRPGQVYWQEQQLPAIDTDKPVQYEYVSFGRWQGQVTLQLNYSIWFSERPPAGRFDLLAGPLDSLIWRVHLDRQGRPLAFDSIHSCGCWYQLYPAKGFASQAVRDGSESVLVDFGLQPEGGQAAQGQKVIELQVRSEDHQLMRAAVKSRYSVQNHAGPRRRLAVANFNELYGLSLANKQGYRSLFDAQGLVSVSQRGERWLFWPMGIASPGAMRSPGTHAIAFVGRRHFDDANILQRVGLIEADDQ